MKNSTGNWAKEKKKKMEVIHRCLLPSRPNFIANTNLLSSPIAIDIQSDVGFRLWAS